ncbi:hypothetical protein R3P38DRAFT_2798471 [Favolaschia claudopus]|uniref:Uncharacterized protein n=1 Tax=Favolaschia claudopus TaxID=2862362 RepID=A0AAW0A1G8_9AGAR
MSCNLTQINKSSYQEHLRRLIRGIRVDTDAARLRTEAIKEHIKGITPEMHLLVCEKLIVGLEIGRLTDTLVVLLRGISPVAWRDAALGYPLLWTDFTVNSVSCYKTRPNPALEYPLAAIQAQLRLSGTAPISVAFQMPGEHKRINDAFVQQPYHTPWGHLPPLSKKAHDNMGSLPWPPPASQSGHLIYEPGCPLDDAEYDVAAVLAKMHSLGRDKGILLLFIINICDNLNLTGLA